MNKNRVYLAQTDTTVGFLSADDKKLSSIKQRPISQKMIQVVDSLKILNQLTRVPKNYRKLVRNSLKTTFIYPNNESYRVIDKNSKHYDFIKKFGVMYSTSANITKTNFDLDYAIKNCDIEVYDDRGFCETTPSKIKKIYKRKILELR